MKKISFCIGCCLIFLSSWKPGDVVPIFEESTVWEFDEDGYWPYHVPGIAVTKRGTVLAYSDARYDDWGDFGPHDLALKRSTDMGKSWGKNMFIVKGENKEIFLFPNCIQSRNADFICFLYTQKDPQDIHRKTRNFVKYSMDDGLSWSQPTEITRCLLDQEIILKKRIEAGVAGPQFEGESADSYGREQFYTGPGNAIQLSESHPVAPNRIIVPLLVIKHRNLPEMMDRGMGNAFLISDDDGLTWKAGGTVPIGELPNSEPAVIELSNGDLLMNARVEGQPVRVISFSRDAGMTWTKSVIEDNIPEYFATHSGMIRLSNPYEERTTSGPILYSFPNAEYRENMTVMISFDETLTWLKPKVVFSGASYYSNMAVLPDKTILLIYGKEGLQGAALDKERRSTTPSGNQRWMPDRTVVARFNLQWLMEENQ